MRPVDLGFIVANKLSIIALTPRLASPGPRGQVGLCGGCQKPLIEDLKTLPLNVSIRCPECGQFNIRAVH